MLLIHLHGFGVSCRVLGICLPPPEEYYTEIMIRLFKTFCKQIHEGVISHLPTVSPHRRKHASNQGREACTVRARCNIYLFIFQYFRVNCPFNGWAYGGILENIVLLNLWHQPFSFFNMTTPHSTNPCTQRHDIWMTCLAISYNWWLKLKCPHTFGRIQ